MKINGLWRIKRNQEKYKNQWLTVIEGEVIRPDEKLDTFSTIEMPDGVCILPIDNNGYAYLIDQFRYTL